MDLRRESIVQLPSIRRQRSPTFHAVWTLGRDRDRGMIGLVLITVLLKSSVEGSPRTGMGSPARPPYCVARCDEQDY